MYAPYLVATKEMRVMRFFNRLIQTLYRVVAPQVYSDYSKVVNYTQRLEIKDMETIRGEDKPKKSRING